MGQNSAPCITADANASAANANIKKARLEQKLITGKNSEANITTHANTAHAYIKKERLGQKIITGQNNAAGITANACLNVANANKQGCDKNWDMVGQKLSRLLLQELKILPVFIVCMFDEIVLEKITDIVYIAQT